MPATLSAPAGQRVLVHNIGWHTYEALLAAFRDHPLRLTYDQGNLEIMAPSFNHERCKRQVGRLIETLAEELDRPLVAGGSTTFRREDLERGLEPDDCFYIANAPRVLGRREIDLRQDPPPDVALEIDVTRSSLDRMDIYAALGVPEVWVFDGETLQGYRLGPDGQYERVTVSPTFPTVPLQQLEEFLRQHAGLDDSSLVRSFRSWIRSHVTSRQPTPPDGSEQP